MAQLKIIWRKNFGAPAIGGASVLASHRANLFSAPNQIKYAAFERPVFNPLNQSFAERIFLNINPFFRIIFTITQTMMPAARLKFPCRRWGESPRRPFVFQTELTFPVGNPSFNCKMQIPWRTKQMQMIRHQQIIANQPSRRFRPSLAKKLMCHFIRQPRFALFCVDSQQNNVGLAKLDMNAGSRILTLRQFIFWRRIHFRKLFFQERLARTLAPPVFFYLLPGLIAGIAFKSGGNLSGSNASTCSESKLTNGTPNFTAPFERSTIVATPTT
jgi:hypothetical protein